MITMKNRAFGRVGPHRRGARRNCWTLAGTALVALMLLPSCTRVDRGSPAVRATPEPPPADVDQDTAFPPTISTFRIGQSTHGEPLMLELFGNGPQHIFIFGGIHGDEPTSAYVARELAALLREQPDALEGRTVGILAEANPDGLRRRTRHNANGVDLNRNFPALNWTRVGGYGVSHGSRPASEPETRAIIVAMEMLHPDRVIAIHSARRGHHCNNYDGPARDLAVLMASDNGYPAKATMGYATPGSFGSWSGVDRAIPTITLELPNDLSGPDCWQQNRQALLSFIRVPRPDLAQ